MSDDQQNWRVDIDDIADAIGISPEPKENWRKTLKDIKEVVENGGGGGGSFDVKATNEIFGLIKGDLTGDIVIGDTPGIPTLATKLQTPSTVGTKLTVNNKGLVTNVTNATTSDIPDFSEVLSNSLLDKPSATIANITKTVALADLSTELDSLPIIINHNVTINVTPGNNTSRVYIRNFSGCGSLTINCNSTDETSNFTHEIGQLIIRNCTLDSISISGLACTTLGCSITRCSSYIELNFCKIVFSSVSTNTTGLNITSTSSQVMLSNIRVTNASPAIRNFNSHVTCYSAMGEGNATVFKADGGGIIQIGSNTIPSGDNLYSATGGGLIVLSNGTIPNITTYIDDSITNLTNYVDTALLTKPTATSSNISKTIAITDLQAELDALPKIINHAVTFTITAGTNATTIFVLDFGGSGSLSLNCQSSGLNTHNLTSFSLQRCSVRGLTLNGFTLTNGLPWGIFAQNIDSGRLYITRCFITPRNSSSARALFFDSVSATVYLSGNNITGAYLGIEASRSPSIIVGTLQGNTGNTVGYLSRDGSNITIESVTGTSAKFTADTMYTTSSGGLIRFVDSSVYPLMTFEDLTITTTLANLQTTLDSLPRCINHNVTINISTGTLTTNIVLNNFTGVGSLNLICTSSAKNTHFVTNITANYCSINTITLAGFTVNYNNSSTASIYVNYCNSNYIYIRNCFVSNANTSNVRQGQGINAYFSTARVTVNNTEISNCTNAVFVSYSQSVLVQNLTGTGNLLVFAVSAGILHIGSNGNPNISGTTRQQITSGGMVIDADGDVYTQRGIVSIGISIGL